jgi:hypothetical protein
LDPDSTNLPRELILSEIRSVRLALMETDSVWILTPEFDYQEDQQSFAFDED